MKYEDFLHRLTKQFDSHVSQIMAKHSFEYGTEFEISLCQLLRKVLPQKYGVCRGYVVSADESAGDDIIIYDRQRFPTLRLFDQDQFERKEYVPVEAVYAYIEAKHTLSVEGSEEDGQSYSKAAKQVTAVKGLPREAAPGYRRGAASGWPDLPNPIFGAIFSRRVRKRKGAPILTEGEATNRAIVEAYNRGRLGQLSPSPDLVVAGNEVIMLPWFRASESETWSLRSPFFAEGSSVLVNMRVPGHAVATGLLVLFFALDNIHLGRMPWSELIDESLREAQRTVLREYLGEES